MGFPKNSRATQALGRAGTRASDNPVRYAPGCPAAGEGGVIAGLFGWKTPAVETNDIYNPDTYLNKGTGAPAGIISAETVQSYIDMGEDATMEIAEGSGVMVAETGDFFMITKTAATVGQKVFANMETGEGYTASAGSTVANAFETDWPGSRAGAADGTIIISNK